METITLYRDGSYYVEMMEDGELVDVAGPFDDRDDADWVEERALRISA